MKNLLLHPKTASAIERALTRSFQGILITGEAGSGKDTVAESLAALMINTGDISTHPYVLIVDPDSGTITIDEIRSINQFLKLKVPKVNTVDRVVIVKRADRMRIESQNALLKTLEEPPERTSIILTTETPERLLPTILSRVQQLAILPIGFEQARTYFTESKEFNSAYALSMGQVGLLSALLSNNEHPLKVGVQTAKAILAEPIGTRLLRIDTLSRDKLHISLLLSALSRIAHAGLIAAGKRRLSETTVKQWLHREETIIQCKELLDKNTNTKLLLCKLFTSI